MNAWELRPDRFEAVAERWAGAFPRVWLERLARSLGETETAPRADERAAARIALRALQRSGIDRLEKLPPANREIWRATFAAAVDLLGTEPALLDAVATLSPPPLATHLVEEPPEGPRPRIPVLAGSCRWDADLVTLTDPLQIQMREVAAQIEVRKVFQEALRGKIFMPSGWKHAPVRTLQRFAETLEGPDFPGGMRARIWPILVTLGDLSTSITKSGRELSPTGRALAAAAPRDALRGLLNAWLDHPEYDDLESMVRLADPRPPVESVQRFLHRRIRRRMSLAAIRCLPVGRFVPVARFIDHLLEVGLLPPVAELLWPSYFTPASMRPVRGTSPTEMDGEPLRLRVPSLLVVLFEVLATLGALDVAWIARGPGVVRARTVVTPWTPVAGPHASLAYVRLTDLGAWLADPLAETRPTGASAASLDALADLLTAF